MYENVSDGRVPGPGLPALNTQVSQAATPASAVVIAPLSPRWERPGEAGEPRLTAGWTRTQILGWLGCRSAPFCLGYSALRLTGLR